MVSGMVRASAAHPGRPAAASRKVATKKAMYAPTMNTSPWAKLISVSTP